MASILLCKSTRWNVLFARPLAHLFIRIHSLCNRCTYANSLLVARKISGSIHRPTTPRQYDTGNIGLHCTIVQLISVKYSYFFKETFCDRFEDYMKESRFFLLCSAFSCHKHNWRRSKVFFMPTSFE